MLNSKTTTTVRIAQTEWLTMSRGSRRKTSSEMSASLPANTGFRGSARANAHSSATAPHAAPHQRATAPPARRSRPSLGRCSSPSPGWEVVGRVQAEESSGTAAPRWSSSVDHSDPASPAAAPVLALAAARPRPRPWKRSAEGYGYGLTGGCIRRWGLQAIRKRIALGLFALGARVLSCPGGREDVQLAEKSAVRCSVCLS
ncbi:unnamed protein product [Miscanthus lutarioriparius]|uniref:Uncharacterized protein n=1 Tax=Miscanthus lutarioriparius TaxID=422564 RepID=A0A811SF38_9POAL|nr:unnamed protein product [Miscanthus lutarioriparius]